MAAPNTYPSLSSDLGALIGYQVPRDMAAPTYIPIYIPIPIKKSRCSDWLSGHEGRSCSHIHTHPYIEKSRCPDWLSHQEGQGNPTRIPIYIPIIPIKKSQCSYWRNRPRNRFVWMKKCHNCSPCGVDEKIVIIALHVGWMKKLS
jgi:hypothetical protein